MRRKLIVSFIVFLLGSISTLLLASIAPNEAVGQFIFVLFGIICFWVLQILDPKLLVKTAPYLALATVFLLLVTLFIGRLSHGAQRWLPVGPFHIQVSEFGKPVIALFLAWFVSKFSLNSIRTMIGFLMLSLCFFLPVFMQPDLGSALVYLVTVSVVMFLSVKKLKMLLPWLICGLLIAVISWQFLLYPYQKDRLQGFLFGTGNASYNAEQAYITVGSGKVFGRGLGHGVQSQLKFLPEFHTDFFFASLAEELGLIGAMTVLILYLILFFQLLFLAPKASKISQITTYGFCSALFFQMAVHMGMNMKLFPITGIPLPLLSSGGSSFLATCLGLGICVRLADEKQIWYTPASSEFKKNYEIRSHLNLRQTASSRRRRQT